MLTLLNAHKKHIEDKEYLQWCIWGQLDCDFKSFRKQQHPKSRSSKEIMKDVYGYIEQFNRGYDKVQ